MWRCRVCDEAQRAEHKAKYELEHANSMLAKAQEEVATEVEANNALRWPHPLPALGIPCPCSHSAAERPQWDARCLRRRLR